MVVLLVSEWMMISMERCLWRWPPVRRRAQGLPCERKGRVPGAGGPRRRRSSRACVGWPRRTAADSAPAVPGHPVALQAGLLQGLPARPVAPGAVQPARILRPGRGLLAGADHEAHLGVHVVGHRRMVRSDRRGAAGHEFHQRQAQALAARGVHVVAGGSVQTGVLRGVEIAVQGDDPAGERRQLGKQGEQFDVVGRQVALGHLQHQRGIAGVANAQQKAVIRVMPVLAPVQRIEHRDVDHPVHDDLLVLVDVRQQRRRMLGLGGRHRLGGLGQWLRQRFQRRWRGGSSRRR